VENTPLFPELISKASDRIHPTFDKDDLDAEMLIQVDMGCGHDDLVVVVLDVGKSIGQLSAVVVVDQRNGADALPFHGPGLLYEAVPDHVPDKFGTVCISAGLYELFEPIREALLNRKTQSCQLGHGSPYYVF